MPRGFSSGHMSEDSQLEANAKEVASAKKEEKAAAKARGASGNTHADGGTVIERPDPGMSTTELNNSSDAMLEKLLNGSQ